MGEVVALCSEARGSVPLGRGTNAPHRDPLSQERLRIWCTSLGYGPDLLTLAATSAMTHYVSAVAVQEETARARLWDCSQQRQCWLTCARPAQPLGTGWDGACLCPQVRTNVLSCPRPCCGSVTMARWDHLALLAFATLTCTWGHSLAWVGEPGAKGSTASLSAAALLTQPAPGCKGRCQHLQNHALGSPAGASNLNTSMCYLVIQHSLAAPPLLECSTPVRTQGSGVPLPAIQGRWPVLLAWVQGEFANPGSA